ncbi:MAG: Trigger factor [Candidatus Anoxychlamydiales bacterium]|nr:Trigger factor [Candidatus Anoxychlamydiales bacterium]
MEPDIKVKIEKKPKCKIEVDIEVSSEIVKEASKQALKDLKKEITLPGFRKGKAPDSAVLKKYPDAYKERLEKKIADISFIKAHEKEKLPALTQESKIVFKIKEYSLEKGAKLHYSYETEPDVPKIDPKAFKISKDKKIEVTKKEIDEAIRQIRFFHAEWKAVDRPIKENDYIIIDLDSIESDAPQRVFSDTRFEVSDKGMAAWMKELVIGKKLNESLKGTSAPDEKATADEKKNFEPKKVLVTIKKIEEAKLPKVDDEFAKKVGAKSEKEMYESITKMLTEQKQTKHNQENRKKVHEFLLKTYKFDVPDSLIQNELNYRKDSYFKNPEFKKKYDKMTKEEIKEFEKDLLTYSEDAIRIFYLSKKIVADFDIKISDDEIKQRALVILYRETGQKPDPKNIPRNVYALAISQLVLNKAEDYILDHSSKT